MLVASMSERLQVCRSTIPLLRYLQRGVALCPFLTSSPAALVPRAGTVQRQVVCLQRQDHIAFWLQAPSSPHLRQCCFVGLPELR